MIARWMTYLSLMSFCLVSFAILQITKRPLCIESRVVERIDRIGDGGSETVFKCSLNKATPFMSFFYENLPTVNARINGVERITESLQPFGRKIQISIIQERPFLFKIQDHQIWIGEQLFLAPGHIEKAIAKIWTREHMGEGFSQKALIEEGISDLILFLQRGDLDIGGFRSLTKSDVNMVKWPSVLKSVQAYCDSPWKQSEHYLVCQNTEEAKKFLKESVAELSLRPLVSQVLIGSYLSLAGAERQGFLRRLPIVLKSHRGGPEASPHFEGDLVLEKANEAIKSVSAFFSENMAGYVSQLRAQGFQDSIVEARFDILYISHDKLTEDSAVLRDLHTLSMKQQKFQIAVKDDENIWMMPSLFPIPLKSFGLIKANRSVLEKCGGYDFRYVLQYSQMTEKLMIIDHCDKSQKLQFEGYLVKGAEGFGIENKGIAFVQFHLPSLMMKRDLLSAAPSVLDLIKDRNLENPSFKSLGWQEIRWDSLANAYQPRAFVDAIEWFRMPTGHKTEL